MKEQDRLKHPRESHLFNKDTLYHSLGHDWDSELNKLHGKDLWDTPNENSREVRRMVVIECLRMSEKIKALPFWRRLFNLF